MSNFGDNNFCAALFISSACSMNMIMMRMVTG